MNHDTKIRFNGLLYHGPAHIQNEMNELIKSYPSETDPVVLENVALKKEIEKLKAGLGKTKGFSGKK